MIKNKMPCSRQRCSEHHGATEDYSFLIPSRNDNDIGTQNACLGVDLELQGDSA